MDISNDGYVSYEEFITFMLGTDEAFLTPTLIAMRPFLNKFMCCFGDAAKSIEASTGFAEDYMPEDRQESHDELISEVLGTGETVILTGLDGLEKHDHVMGKINHRS